MEMKMAEVFGSEGMKNLHLLGALALTGPEAEAAVLAVKNHDRLTEENKRLRDLLEQIRAFKKQIDEGLNVYGGMSGLMGSIDIIDETLSELGGE
ncbi:hypothetical protein O1B50_000102 [Vibrio cholerae]|nr:hypothetical protein [Vibrio cholerae]